MSADQPEKGTAAQPAKDVASAEVAEPPPPPPPPSPPWWRRLWGTLHSRFARQLAMVAVVAGGIAAVGHFVGGILGWWHAYEFAFGPRHGAQTSGKVVQGTAEGLSMVVLPLTVEGESADSEWFADVLLGDLIAALARVQSSFVIARDTAQTYKGKTIDPREVARELNVRYVVRGSLRREGTQIRLGMALIDGGSGRQRWAETFSFDRAQLGQALDDFTFRLARHLSMEVYRSAADRPAAMSTEAVSADDLAMRAVGLWFRGITRENLLEANKLFEQAVAKDQDSVRAWGGLAYINFNLLTNGWAADRAAAVRRIDEAALQLDRLDPDSFYGYQAKTIQSFLRKDWTAMLRHGESWVKQHQHAVAHGGYGIALVFNGRPGEGIPHFERALRLSPRDTIRAEWQYRLSLAHFLLGEYEQSREWGLTAQATNPRLPWPPVHAAAMLRLGKKDEAKQAFDEFIKRNPTYTAERIPQRMPDAHPRFIEGREQLVASLRELGLK
jgi:TolB-like protein